MYHRYFVDLLEPADLSANAAANRQIVAGDNCQVRLALQVRHERPPKGSDFTINFYGRSLIFIMTGSFKGVA